MNRSSRPVTRSAVQTSGSQSSSPIGAWPLNASARRQYPVDERARAPGRARPRAGSRACLAAASAARAVQVCSVSWRSQTFDISAMASSKPRAVSISSPAPGVSTGEYGEASTTVRPAALACSTTVSSRRLPIPRRRWSGWTKNVDVRHVLVVEQGQPDAGRAHHLAAGPGRPQRLGLVLRRAGPGRVRRRPRRPDLERAVGAGGGRDVVHRVQQRLVGGVVRVYFDDLHVTAHVCGHARTLGGDRRVRSSI